MASATGFRATAEPRTCACGATYKPRRRDQWRCGDCRTKNRASRSKPERERIADEERRIERINERRFIGIDGEGINEPSNYHDEDWQEGDEVYDDHRYRFMAASEIGPDGVIRRLPDLEPRPGDRFLRTSDIFRWLWDISKRTDEEREAGIQGPSLWFYGSKYDWTNILRSVAIKDAANNFEFLHDLFHPPVDDPFKTFWWGKWGISYVQASVELKVRWWDKETGEQIAPRDGRFFQDGFKCWGGGSFVSQLKSWQVGTPEVWDRIENMKDKRAHFGEITEEIRDYCREEVDLLAQMAQKITLTAAGLDIRPNKGRWYSAGSAAKAMLRLHKIPAETQTINGEEIVTWEGYRGPDRYAGADPRITDILMRSFFGGWFDLFETGIFAELHSIDLASAYPFVIRYLPCLSHGQWEDGRSDNPRALTYGHVSWSPTDLDHEVKVAPFPWRAPTGHTCRPRFGEGWYVGELIDAAKRLGGYDIDELEWVSFVPECDHQPFTWVQDVYDQRLKWGKEGRGLVLKVSLNSIYGTFADTLSLDSRYASIVWAGTITGRTQARILEVLADHQEEVVCVATDGIVSKNPIVTTLRPPAKVLGGWDYEGAMYDVLFIQPGLYLAGSGEEPKKTQRTRGHGLKDMREIETELREAWLRDGWDAQVTYPRTRFIPAKLAIARSDPLAVYAQWVEEHPTVKFRPSNREPIDVPGPVKPSAPTQINFKYYGTDQWCSAPYIRLLAMQVRQLLLEAKELEDAQP